MTYNSVVWGTSHVAQVSSACYSMIRHSTVDMKTSRGDSMQQEPFRGPRALRIGCLDCESLFSAFPVNMSLEGLSLRNRI